MNIQKNYLLVYMLIMKANEMHYFSDLFDKVLYMFCWRLLVNANRTSMTNTYCVYTLL